jgi:hypothetical protein
MHWGGGENHQNFKTTQLNVFGHMMENTTVVR